MAASPAPTGPAPTNPADNIVAAEPIPLDQTYASINEQLAAITLNPATRWRWLAGLVASGLLVVVLAVSIGDLFVTGVGIWGVNIPVNWGVAIIAYVWWIAIGSAGTLISALLLLLGQEWRNSLNRFAEAMTVFAVVCAAIYPILHLGRPWFFYWLFPYPNVMAVWPQFRSPLEWDVFAVPIYLIVSIIFWYIGMIPDLASLRDRATRRRWQVFFGILSLGWRGSVYHWMRWQQCYRLVAAMAVPLVVSVHSGVALLYTVGQLPGWHSTIFPPFFIIGAIYSGFAVVALIAIVMRHAFRLGNLVTERHLNVLGLVILACGFATGYNYMSETFTSWYSGDPYERALLMERFVGVYAWSFWSTIFCNVISIQVLWSRTLRSNPVVLFIVSLIVTIGMWLERFMLQTTALYIDYLPSNQFFYAPSFWDWSTFAGTVGLFFFLFFLFVRLLPVMSIFEVKEVLEQERKEAAKETAATPATAAGAAS